MTLNTIATGNYGNLPQNPITSAITLNPTVAGVDEKKANFLTFIPIETKCNISEICNL
jgi:hypothetical protein